jgi:hypothetical protein
MNDTYMHASLAIKLNLEINYLRDSDTVDVLSDVKEFL